MTLHNENQTMEEFFAHKNVFITGGTGFLGTVLIEAILSASPNVGKIYVLVRDKYGSNANSRIQRMLSKKLFANHSEETLKKVLPVLGELSEPNFGMSDELLDNLHKTINIIYHSAATIKFKTPMRQAIITNLTGTMRTIEFAKKLHSLAAYIYVSTAFCNSNHRGRILEKMYVSEEDPYEMMKLAENEKIWGTAEEPDTAKLIGEHPNTYTFTKQLAENLICREMSGMPTGIVRPSVVYGTYQHPVPGWVGNATSGHLGLMAGYVKGVFRTISGNPRSVIDVIPCDYVINASMTLGWYVGTRSLDQPEIIHCTSGERNPLTIEKFRDHLNSNACKDPCDAIVWMPYAKIRNGWRCTVFFYLFHYLPALLFYLPETILGIGKPHHTSLAYMRIFHRGTKAFDYFLNTEFKYSLDNSMRVMAKLQPGDLKRYNFDAVDCDWSSLIQRSFLGIRRYYYRESFNTTMWHHTMYKIFEILYYIGWACILAVLYFSILPMTSSISTALTIATGIWLFLIWL